MGNVPFHIISDGNDGYDTSMMMRPAYLDLNKQVANWGAQ